MPNPMPAHLAFQLLRSIGQTAQKEAQLRERGLCLGGLRMSARQAQDRLSAALDHAPHRAQEQRADADRFAGARGVGAAHEGVLPIVNQGGHSRRHLAAQ